MSRRTATPPSIPGFEYAEKLGSGGFSEVYRYTETGLGRSVAVKVLHGDGLDQSAFREEAKVMAQLGNHPSIVSIFQAGMTDRDEAFLVMEYCPPPHLGTRLRSKPLAVAKALEITVQLAGAVETAHRLGILHRDIKPANILFTEFARPALTDFGISSTTGSAAAGQGVGMSVPWAPPEQLRQGAAMGVTADVYSLAATMWTSLAGHSPFHVVGGANDPMAMAPRVRTLEVPRIVREDVPESLQRILRVAMAKQAEDRFANAIDFARALQSVQAEMHQSISSIEVRDHRLSDGDVVEDGQGGTRVTGFVSIDPDGPSAVMGTRPEPPGPVVPDRGWGGRVTSVPRDIHDATSTSGGLSGDSVAERPSFTRAGQTDHVDDTVLGGADHGGQRPTDLERDGGASIVPAPAPAPAPSGLGPRRVLAAASATAVLVVVGVVAASQAGGDSKGTVSDDPVPTPGAVAQAPVTESIPPPTGITVAREGGMDLLVTWTNPAPEAGDTYLYKLVDDLGDTGYATTADTTARVVGKPGRLCVYVKTVRSDGRSSESAQGCPGGES